MIGKLISNVKFRNLSDPKHKDRILRLWWIQDIFTKPSENYYKVLFRDVKTGMFLREHIPPEFLSYYTIGCHYKNSALYKDIPSIGTVMSIKIDSTERNLIRIISKVITDKNYDLRSSGRAASCSSTTIDFTDANKRQYCVLFETERQIIIFPCAVIGAAYYFTSTSMRQQIFAENLRGLYEYITREPDLKTAMIVMKPGSKKEDAQNIVRFEQEKSFSNMMWKSIKNNLLRKKKELEFIGAKSAFVPLEIDFPVKQNLSMTVRALICPGNADTKEKILVFQIIKEDSHYDFEYLIRVRRQQQNKALDDENEIIPTSAKQTSNTLTNEPPSSDLSPATIIDKREKINTSDEEITIFDEVIEATESKIRPLREIISESVDMSVILSELHGEKSARPASVEQSHDEMETPKEKLAFNLNDFRCMSEILKKYQDVVDFQVHEQLPIPARNESGQKFSLREIYNKVSKERREYLWVTFKYLQFSVCLIEIDQTTMTNGCATYGLVIPGAYMFALSEVEEVLNAYVRFAKIGDIATKMGDNGFIFLSKNHPAQKDESYYIRWCEELLRKVVP